MEGREGTAPAGGARGKSAARAAPAAVLRALVPCAPHQKAVGQHDRHGMAVEPFPEAALVLLPAQQFLGLCVILPHPGAAVGILDRDRKAVDILAEAPGHRLFKTVAEVDDYVRKERDG